MKNDQSKLIILTLAMLTSWAVQAGTVGTTFTPSGTLTADQMTEIKDAVNDNDTNVNTNATGITTNATAIGGNTTAIGANTTAITGNSTAITGNSTAITGNSTGIADNTIKIDSVFGGDGSTGSLTVSVNTDWSQRTSFNFVDLNIDPNITLTVPAGTTIRCSGNFNNAGNIVVDGGVRGGNGALSTTFTYPYRRNPHPGDSFGVASNGGYDHTLAGNSNMQVYGDGGRAIPLAAAASSYHLFRYGGGAGGGGTGGGDGGGLLKIYARGTITNQTDASIQANGADGLNVSGGGGGGIIILASMTSVTNSVNGTIETIGGNGGTSRTFGWAGGGGGGGIAMLIAPIVNSNGTVSVVGGAGGPQIDLPVGGTFGYGGGGGGASGGDGGRGGYNLNGTTIAPADGTAGHTILVNSIPSSLF